MTIAIIGAGAIGGLVAGYLKAKGEDVSLVAHPEAVSVIKRQGLEISGVRGNLKVDIASAEKLESAPELAILCAKTQDVAAALKENLSFLENSILLTTQNGVQADSIASQYIPKENIISSIVMFGSTYLEPGKITHNFEGPWIIGRAFGNNDPKVVEVSGILNQIFPAIIAEDIKGMKYLKIFVNANNCIAAILGRSMQEAFSDVETSKISIAIWKEGLEVVNKAGVKLESLPDFPLERLVKLTSLPAAEAAKIFSVIMANLSKEPLYGSILQSIKRGRASEIDYINGEFVRLAQANNFQAPLNEKLVEMVHEVEKTNKFFSREELLNSAKGLIS